MNNNKYMNKLLLLILLVSFYSFADSKKYEITYLNYLNKCAMDVTYSSHHPYSDKYPTLVFTGKDLSTDCLVEQFALHHKKSKIPDPTNVNNFLEVSNIEFVKKDNHSTITSLYDFTCGENCKIGQNILIENKNKFYLIVSFNSDAGYEGNFVNKNMIHIKEKMHTRTHNTLFNVKTHDFNNIGSGDVEFTMNGYLKKGIKSYAFQDGEPQGAFWFNARYSFDNNLLEIIDYEGEDQQCLPMKFFKSNEIIINNLKQFNKESLCVMKF